MCNLVDNIKNVKIMQSAPHTAQKKDSIDMNHNLGNPQPSMLVWLSVYTIRSNCHKMLIGWLLKH